MRKQFFSAAVILTVLAGAAVAVENPLIGVVNFTTCITDSKYGKKEQESLEGLRKQMSSLVENTEKELRELSSKFDDTEYLDSLSPKAEDELKAKHQSLSEDMGRYQQQFYQVLNQANSQLIQKMIQIIGKASKIVAEQKRLDCIINQEACFYTKADLDVTTMVIEEMNRQFDVDQKAKKVSDLDGDAVDDSSDEENFDFLSENLMNGELPSFADQPTE